MSAPPSVSCILTAHLPPSCIARTNCDLIRTKWISAPLLCLLGSGILCTTFKSRSASALEPYGPNAEACSNTMCSCGLGGPMRVAPVLALPFKVADEWRFASEPEERHSTHPISSRDDSLLLPHMPQFVGLERHKPHRLLSLAPSTSSLERGF